MPSPEHWQEQWRIQCRSSSTSPHLQFTGPDGQEDMPYLLTPGPLTTSRGVKLAMLADWGSRDVEFRADRRGYPRRAAASWPAATPAYECVIMQGSGTFAIEAALGSFCPRAAARRSWSSTAPMASGPPQSSKRLGRPCCNHRQGRQRQRRRSTKLNQCSMPTERSAMSGSSIAKRPPASSIRSQEIAKAAKAARQDCHGRCHVVLRRPAPPHGRAGTST